MSDVEVKNAARRASTDCTSPHEVGR